MPVEVGPEGLVWLSPSDVSKIEVLKDAGSLSAYGVRGANGVILISTRIAK
jgi:TonB-dependent SusC/RagA subfamily outer membrane receptor